MRLPSVRSSTPLDLTMGHTEEVLDAQEANLMGRPAFGESILIQFNIIECDMIE